MFIPEKSGVLAFLLIARIDIPTTGTRGARRDGQKGGKTLQKPAADKAVDRPAVQVLKFFLFNQQSRCD